MEKEIQFAKKIKKDPTQGSAYVTCLNSDLGLGTELQVGS